MRRVFLDTVGLQAVWNVRDPWHETAAGALAALTAAGTEFWTTTYVLLECGNAAARTPCRGDVIELRQQLLTDRRLVTPTEGDCLAAWDAYRRGKAGDPGIADLVSFTVMRRLGLSEAFTNDKHFAAAGFQILF